MKDKISLNELRKVRGIGEKTMGRVKEQLRDDDYISEYNPELHLEKNSINNGDCLELMNGIKNKSVDMILADLPYGTTACNWDSIIDLDKLWLQYERVIKDNGAIVLTASQPFTTELINSNQRLFKYDLIWLKNKPSGAFLAKKRPMKSHEDILVFAKKQHKYNPQMVKRTEEELKKLSYKSTETENGESYNGGKANSGNRFDYKYKYPNSLLEYKTVFNRSDKRVHENQKPVKLFEYLIKTYTNEGDLVLDNVSGSGTTAVACINTDRNYICIEQDEEYYEKSIERINNV